MRLLLFMESKCFLAFGLSDPQCQPCQGESQPWRDLNPPTAIQPSHMDGELQWLALDYLEFPSRVLYGLNHAKICQGLVVIRNRQPAAWYRIPQTTVGVCSVLMINWTILQIIHKKIVQFCLPALKSKFKWMQTTLKSAFSGRAKWNSCF